MGCGVSGLQIGNGFENNFAGHHLHCSSDESGALRKPSNTENTQILLSVRWRLGVVTFLGGAVGVTIATPAS